MMTRYEQLTRKINALQATALRCCDRGSRFTTVWMAKMWELKQVRDNLTVQEAGKWV